VKLLFVETEAFKPLVKLTTYALSFLNLSALLSLIFFYGLCICCGETLKSLRLALLPFPFEESLSDWFTVTFTNALIEDGVIGIKGTIGT